MASEELAPYLWGLDDQGRSVHYVADCVFHYDEGASELSLEMAMERIKRGNFDFVLACQALSPKQDAPLHTKISDISEYCVEFDSVTSTSAEVRFTTRDRCFKLKLSSDTPVNALNSQFISDLCSSVRSMESRTLVSVEIFDVFGVSRPITAVSRTGNAFYLRALLIEASRMPIQFTISEYSVLISAYVGCRDLLMVKDTFGTVFQINNFVPSVMHDYRLDRYDWLVGEQERRSITNYSLKLGTELLPYERLDLSPQKCVLLTGDLISPEADLPPLSVIVAVDVTMVSFGRKNFMVGSSTSNMWYQLATPSPEYAELAIRCHNVTVLYDELIKHSQQLAAWNRTIVQVHEHCWYAFDLNWVQENAQFVLRSLQGALTLSPIFIRSIEILGGLTASGVSATEAAAGVALLRGTLQPGSGLALSLPPSALYPLSGAVEFPPVTSAPAPPVQEKVVYGVEKVFRGNDVLNKRKAETSAAAADEEEEDDVYGSRSQWTVREVEQLKSMVADQLSREGKMDWAEIARRVNRTKGACAEKYKMVRIADVKVGLFTLAEDNQILQRYREWKDPVKTGLWIALEKELKRPRNMVRQRWNRCLCRQFLSEEEGVGARAAAAAATSGGSPGLFAGYRNMNGAAVAVASPVSGFYGPMAIASPPPPPFPPALVTSSASNGTTSSSGNRRESDPETGSVASAVVVSDGDSVGDHWERTGVP